MSDSDPNLSRQASSQERHAESLVVAMLKCCLVGIGVGLAGIAICFLMLSVLLSLRAVGLMLLLVLIPFAAYFIWGATGKYLAEQPSRYRGAIALGVRYLVVGAGLGLVLKFVMGGFISDTAIFVFCGSVIGTTGGSLGGAFQGWFQSRGKPELVETSKSD